MGGCLARAIRTNQRHDFALIHRERNAFQRVNVAVVGMHIIDFQ
jgi:hypothetical protein